MLLQNITPTDFSYRVPQLATGQSKLRFNNVKNIIPEGITNNTVFAIGGEYENWDVKCGFFFYAVVLDDSHFYQWKIAEMDDLKDKHYHWFKSELFDLKPLLKLYEEYLMFETEFRNNKFDDIDKIVNLYERIEKERESIRQKIVYYHDGRKDQTKNILTTMSVPPLYSFFDEVDVNEKGYRIASHLEPLFYRGAIRNCRLAEDANKKIIDPENKHSAIIDEMEYSATCIILSANCLESYINFVITKYLPKESSVFVEKGSTHRQKWLWFPSAMDLPDKFDVESPPYLHFSELIDWRNSAIHHTPQLTNVKKYMSTYFKGEVSKSYSVFNSNHAKRAVDIVKEMILFLSKGNKIPKPEWLDLAPDYY